MFETFDAGAGWLTTPALILALTLLMSAATRGWLTGAWQALTSQRGNLAARSLLAALALGFAAVSGAPIVRADDAPAAPTAWRGLRDPRPSPDT